MRVAVVFELSRITPEVARALAAATSFAAEEVSPGRWDVVKDDNGSAPRAIGVGRSLGAALGEHLARTTHVEAGGQAPA